MHTIKLFVVFALVSLFKGVPASYEKDLKLTATVTKMGAMSARGIVIGITNTSKNDHDISVLDQVKANDCPLYVSFTAYMQNGKGKWEELPSKYRVPSTKDYTVPTKAYTVKAGTSYNLFSMLLEPSKMFILNGVGSIKIVAHYKYQEVRDENGKHEKVNGIPSFVLHSDTVIVNYTKQ